MNKSLIRSIGFWLLIVLSVASGAVGGWLVNSQLSTMTATLLDGTATGVEVYVGQSLVVLGSAFIGAGVLGILIALALVAVRSLIPAPAPAALEPIDWSAQQPAEPAAQDAPSEAGAPPAAASDAEAVADSDAPVTPAPDDATGPTEDDADAELTASASRS
jgi:hypothetical protein